MADAPTDQTANEKKNDATTTQTKNNASGKQDTVTVATPTVPVSAEPELSNAEKKKLAKAQKAARRAQEKTIPPQVDATPAHTVANGTVVTNGKEQKPLGRRASMGKETKPKPGAAEVKSQAKVPEAQAPKGEKALPIRTKASEVKLDKQLGMVAHLYGQTRKHTVEGSAKEVHPAILALGFQLSNYEICGSHARCVAMLLALKAVVRSYSTPHGTSLPRHLSSHYLSPQLAHIKSARPFSITQANAIRWLKNIIATIDPSVPEDIAKTNICTAIDVFVRDRFTIADQVIADAAATRIRDGDVVLTFAKSTVVQTTLLTAARTTKFRVVAVDSRPFFEAKNLARTLASAGIEVTYCMTSGLSQAAQDVTLCVLGAHAVFGNGRLYSRAGTALVAMMAKQRHVPVIVCAESIKFTERVGLDSIVMNELAPEEELIIDGPVDTAAMQNPGAAESDKISTMKDWREKDNLLLLNVMYDVTPAEMIDIVVSEYGSAPPTSAPIVQRMSAGT